MKKLLLTIISMSVFANLFGQSYSTLWKEYENAVKKDLPKSCVEILDKIAAKAVTEKEYQHLIKAELQRTDILQNISRDSLNPQIEKLKARAESLEQTAPVASAIYYLALSYHYQNIGFWRTKDEKALNERLAKEYGEKALALPELLAAEKVDNWNLLVKKNVDGAIFGNDLLSVMGFAGKRCDILRDYYKKTGNRRAEAICAFHHCENTMRDGNSAAFVRDKEYAPILDSLMEEYKDVPECGYIARARCEMNPRNLNESEEERFNLVKKYQKQFAGTELQKFFNNQEKELIAPNLSIPSFQSLRLPNKAWTMDLSFRNAKELNISIIPLNIAARNLPERKSEKYFPNLLSKYGQKNKARTQTKTLSPEKPYRFYQDSIEIPALPVGVYLLKFNLKTNKDFEVSSSTTENYEILYVSDLRIVRQAMPNKKQKLLVLNATTGHEVKGAKNATKDRNMICAYTADDEAFPYSYLWLLDNYSYNENKDTRNYLNLFLDRGIYCPGQTVNVAAILHKTVAGKEMEVLPNKTFTLEFRNVNRKTIAKKELTTDEFGKAATEFVIPEGELTGSYQIWCGEYSTAEYFKVEEYKRPTFTVEFDEVKQKYAIGDTVKVTGVAKTYAGVPVANAGVDYTITRTKPYWCWWVDRVASEEMADSTTTTDDEGRFTIDVVMNVPELDDADDYYRANYYNFEIEASVTNLAGESQEAQTVVPVGTKPVALYVSLPKRIEQGKDFKMEVVLKNNAGKDIENATLVFSIDGKGSYKTITDVKAALKTMVSGKHKLTLKACVPSPTASSSVSETAEADFTLFSLDDATPVEETPDWFYATAYQFKDSDDTVSMQFGSSCEDVEIFYTVFSGNKTIADETLHCSNSLIRKDFKYKEEYGDGLLVTMIWMKEGELYSHNVQIRRPEPNKKLTLKWNTFRNKLTPGQKEEWSLNITDAEGKPMPVQLLAGMYDKSLDALERLSWSIRNGYFITLPYTTWNTPNAIYGNVRLFEHFKTQYPRNFQMSYFNIWPFDDSFLQEVVVTGYGSSRSSRKYARVMMAKAAPMYESVAVEEDAAPMADMALNETVELNKLAPKMMAMTGSTSMKEAEEKIDDSSDLGTEQIQMRENFAETAFFYPQLVADSLGNVNIKFTLPESVTTWKFRALAHSKDLHYGLFDDEAIAQKQLMIQPNMPRFIRKGDKAVIASTVSNLSEEEMPLTVKMEVLDAKTEKVLSSKQQKISLEAGKTQAVNFDFAPNDYTLIYIIRLSAAGNGHSDGEQHYLPVLDNVEPVLNTKAITQVKPGKEIVKTKDLFPADATEKVLTVEKTENPAWLMIETLPYMAQPQNNDVYSQAAAYYANALGEKMMKSSPAIKKYVQGDEFKAESKLAQNEELKTLLLRETPWAMDADGETERMQMLRNFYDENKLRNNQESIIKKIKNLQKSDGGWSWWEGMPTSYHITSEVCELFVRLKVMLGSSSETSQILEKALKCLSKKAHEEIVEMKKEEKKGHEVYIYDCYALQFLYLKALKGDGLTSSEKTDADFLLKYLKKQERKNSLYMKAKLAIVLHYLGEKELAKEYLQSIKEYSVYKENMGRYFDTARAGYSWRNYTQPTQTMAIEALQLITPADKQTIAEMQRWLLMQKRQQMWDTPINTVNNVSAFLSTDNLKLLAQSEKGYDKKVYRGKEIPAEIVFEKKDESVSWGAVYAQFKQPLKTITNYAEGLTVKREVVGADGMLLASTNNLKVGSKIKVRITITADRDYDFVQIVDKRAACLEPVNQLSGYSWQSRCYIAPNDTRTSYFFDQFSKGTHIVETEYFIDRAGNYSSGICTVQCAYAPEFYGRTGAKNFQITNK